MTERDPNFEWSDHDTSTNMTECLNCKHVYSGKSMYCPECDHWQGKEKDNDESD